MSKFIHPETEKGEIWLGNTTRAKFVKLNWRTKRIGKSPCDRYGAKITSLGDWFPVFIEEHELISAGKTLQQARNTLK